MKRLLPLGLAVLMLSGCATLGAIPTSPGAVASATVLDEKAAIGFELAYQGAALAATTAIKAGFIKGPAATRVALIDNKAYAAVKAVRTAYDSSNATDYATAATKAQAALAELLDAIK
jgi:hypothetical protein